MPKVFKLEKSKHKILVYLLKIILKITTKLFKVQIFFQATLFSKSGIELTLRLRKKAYSAILCQDISYFDELKNNTGTLCSRLSSDAALVQGCTGSRLGVIIKNFSSLGL